MISKARKEKNQPDHRGGLCAVILAMEPQQLPTREQLVELLGGDRSVASMPMVAKEFGFSAHTVKQSWKTSGMPGGEGNYPLADILLWKLHHDRQNEKFTRANNSITDEIRRIELADKLFDHEQKKIKALQATGEALAVAEVQAELFALITMVKEMFLNVPRSIAPMLPANIVDETTTELTKQIRNCLAALSNGQVCGIELPKLVQELSELIKKHGPLKSCPARKKIK